MISFWQQLWTRKIVRWALACLAGAWLVLQLLSLPSSTCRAHEPGVTPP
jgi:hypothetical protein